MTDTNCCLDTPMSPVLSPSSIDAPDSFAKGAASLSSPPLSPRRSVLGDDDLGFGHARQQSSRKSTNPSRSAQSSSLGCLVEPGLQDRVFKLDVYDAYLRHPRQLFKMGKAELPNAKFQRLASRPKSSGRLTRLAEIERRKREAQATLPAVVPAVPVALAAPALPSVPASVAVLGSPPAPVPALILASTVSEYPSAPNTPKAVDAPAVDSEKKIRTYLTKGKAKAQKGHKQIAEIVSDLVNSDCPLFNMDDFANTSGAPVVYYKATTATPFEIEINAEGYDQLTFEEIRTCEALRIQPPMYFHIKRTMLTAVHTIGPFRKRDAQDWFRIDVNKTNKLYDWFQALGWIPQWSFDERRGRRTT